MSSFSIHIILNISLPFQQNKNQQVLMKTGKVMILFVNDCKSIQREFGHFGGCIPKEEVDAGSIDSSGNILGLCHQQ